MRLFLGAYLAFSRWSWVGIKKNNLAAHYWVSPDSGLIAAEFVVVNICIFSPSATTEPPGDVGVSLFWAWCNSWPFLWNILLSCVFWPCIIYLVQKTHLPSSVICHSNADFSTMGHCFQWAFGVFARVLNPAFCKNVPKFTNSLLSSLMSQTSWSSNLKSSPLGAAQLLPVNAG